MSYGNCSRPNKVLNSRRPYGLFKLWGFFVGSKGRRGMTKKKTNKLDYKFVPVPVEVLGSRAWEKLTNPACHACPFYSYRMDKGRPSVKVIRKFCLQCMGTRADFVRKCETADCLCHLFRMGKNPNRTGKGYFAGQVNNNKAKKQAMNEGSAVKFK
jgi:hypothetical protein